MAASSSAGPSTIAGQPTADELLGAELATRLQCRVAGTEELLATYESAKQLIERTDRAGLAILLKGKDSNALGPSLRKFGRRPDLPEWVAADVTHLIAATVARSKGEKRALAPTQHPRPANRQLALEEPAPDGDVELEHPVLPIQEEDCKSKEATQCKSKVPTQSPLWTQDQHGFLELPRVPGRKHRRTSTSKRPDKHVGQATLWQLEQRGIISNPEVGKVVGNCVEMLTRLVSPEARDRRRTVGPDYLAAVRTRELVEELARRLPAGLGPGPETNVNLSARVAGTLCGIPAKRARRHHITYLKKLGEAH